MLYCRFITKLKNKILFKWLFQARNSNSIHGILLSFFSQGVTLTDLQEAEKTIGRSRPTKTREEEKEEKEKQDKEKQEEKKETETKEDDYRSKYRSFEEVHFCSELVTSLYCVPWIFDYMLTFLPSSSPLKRYRPSLLSSSSASTISTANTASTPSYSSTTLSSSSSSLNRPNSLIGITSSYSRSSRDTEKGQWCCSPLKGNLKNDSLKTFSCATFYSRQ